MGWHRSWLLEHGWQCGTATLFRLSLRHSPEKVCCLILNREPKGTNSKAVQASLWGCTQERPACLSLPALYQCLCQSAVWLTHHCPLPVHTENTLMLAKVMRKDPFFFALMPLLNRNCDQIAHALKARSFCLNRGGPDSLLFTFQTRAPISL